MNTLTITRGPSTDEGTFGRAVLDSGEEFDSLELPWHDNAPMVSCIPPGTYRAEKHHSPHFNRDLYELQDVEGRSEILIHQGNWAGDKSKGFRSDVTGCILLGQETGMLAEQKALLRSKFALNDFHKATNGEPIQVVIQWRS